MKADPFKNNKSSVFKRSNFLILILFIALIINKIDKKIIGNNKSKLDILITFLKKIKNSNIIDFDMNIFPSFY